MEIFFIDMVFLVVKISGKSKLWLTPNAQYLFRSDMMYTFVRLVSHSENIRVQSEWSAFRIPNTHLLGRTTVQTLAISLKTIMSVYL
jgi:hypothetical protein